MPRYIDENLDPEEYLTLQEPRPAAYLSLLVEGRVSHSFPLRGDIQLGREKSNAIVVADQKVSRHHANLTQIDSAFIISDQGSANGTYINGVLIGQPTRLKNNDRIDIGDTTFVFSTGSPDPYLNERPLPFSLQASVHPRSSALISAVSQKSQNVWVLLSCMILIIVTLMIVLAMVLGLVVGRNQTSGLTLLWLVNLL